MKLVFCLILFFSSIEDSMAWGQIGHRIVGEIASKHITHGTRTKVKKLLGNESLAQVSTWPDFIKSDPKMRSKYNHLHYINIPKGKTPINKADYIQNENILTAIDKFTNMIANKKLDKSERAFALKFLVHLIGDLHQPLHAGYKKDKGGNDIKLTWFGENTNLHRIWDENLIELQKLSFTEYVSFINHVSPKNKDIWSSTTPFNWLQESRAYIKNAYNYKVKKYWEYDYNFQHIKFLNKRLLQAGVRLAYILNKNLK